MDSLFPEDSAAEGLQAPLADRMRPERLEDFVGQEHLLGPGRVLRRLIESDQIASIILWGPPGVGKTTLAAIIARRTRAHFVSVSAVLVGVREVRQIIEAARRRQGQGVRTLLFVDEIHRFNKAQQDAFLPHVEKGTVILVGATTENPSFEVISALLSRSRVFVLHPLEEEAIVRVLEGALRSPRGLGPQGVACAAGVLGLIARCAGGDARTALNLLELSSVLAGAGAGAPPCPVQVGPEHVREAVQKRVLQYDKSGEAHFDMISALHKSMRNSDPQAALYWMARMLESGEDPLYVARRMVRFASEDVGLADPGALRSALDAAQAAQFVGLPECKLALAQAAVYLALAPKSDSLYQAYQAVERDLQEQPAEPVPLHLRNAVTPLLENLGYGSGYRSAHQEPERTAAMQCLPPALSGRKYYHAGSQGLEKELGVRLREWERKRREG